MTDRSIVISGPVTDAELHEIFLLMQNIESRHPENSYKIVIDDPSSTASVADTLELMEKLNPRRKGYERTIGFDRRKKPN